MRDNKVIDTFLAKEKDKKKDMELFKILKKEVNVGANGTQSYVIKAGINKGKLIEKKNG